MLVDVDEVVEDVVGNVVINEEVVGMRLIGRLDDESVVATDGSSEVESARHPAADTIPMRKRMKYDRLTYTLSSRKIVKRKVSRRKP